MNTIDLMKSYPAAAPGANPFLLSVPGQPSAGALPFLTGYPDAFLEERKSFEDARRLQSFYPEIARMVQGQVEEECDKMEYEGSMMFDEYPDRLMMRKLAEGITEKVKAMAPEEPEEEQPAQNPGGTELFGMQAGGRRHRPGKRDDWLGDLVQVMLVDEMHRRRCRHRRCRSPRFW